MNQEEYDKLDKNKWYWISNCQEGDIFYPVFVKDNGYIQLDCYDRPPQYFNGATFHKAEMPE